MRLRHLGVLLVTPVVTLPCLLSTASVARAAEATDVLDALDGKDLFDANAELSYRAHTKTAKITREDLRGGQTVEVTEFQYFEHSHQVIPKLRVGVFQDIELFVALPVTAWEQRLGWFHPRGANPGQDPTKKGYSTFIRDMCMYGGPRDPAANNPGERPADCEGYGTDSRRTLSGDPSSWPVNHRYTTDADGNRQTGEYTGRDTDWNISSQGGEEYNPQFNTIRGALAYNFDSAYYLYPKGLGDLEAGFAFSPYSIGRFNDFRDSAMPAMRIEFKLQAPSGWVDTPSPDKPFAKRERLGFVNERRFEPGGVGSGLWRLSGSVAMSKRYKVVDPFMTARYTLGIPQPYPNLAPERRIQDLGFWSNVASGAVGVEFVPLYYAPQVEEYVNLRFMLAMTGDYVAKHRGPSEMSDALRKWTYVDNYFAILGEAGFVLAVPFVTVRALFQAGHETPHFITGEAAGYDANGDGKIAKSEVNPFYNPLLDTPGRRVRVTETMVANGMLTLAATF